MEYIGFQYTLVRRWEFEVALPTPSVCEDWGVLSSGTDMANECPDGQKIRQLQSVPVRLVILA